MSRITKLLGGVILDFGFLLFIYFIGRLIAFVFTATFDDGEHTNPIVFSFVWIFLLFIIPYFILTKRGLNKYKILGFLVVIALISPLSIIASKAIAGIFIEIDNYELVENNYIGLVGTDDRESDALYQDGNTTTDYSHGFVFTKNDSRINLELKKLGEGHEDVEKRKFIFWQTALAEGYKPKYITTYNCCKNFSDKLELYFTVGPLVILECFIQAINDALLILLIPLIFRIFNKPIFFTDFKTFKQYINHDIYK